MSVSLSKGQRVSLAKRDGGTLTRVRMGLGWDAVKKKGLFGGLKTSRSTSTPRRCSSTPAATWSTRCGSSSCAARTGPSSTPGTT